MSLHARANTSLSSTPGTLLLTPGKSISGWCESTQVLSIGHLKEIPTWKSLCSAEIKKGKRKLSSTQKLQVLFKQVSMQISPPSLSLIICIRVYRLYLCSPPSGILCGQRSLLLCSYTLNWVSAHPFFPQKISVSNTALMFTIVTNIVPFP